MSPMSRTWTQDVEMQVSLFGLAWLGSFVARDSSHAIKIFCFHYGHDNGYLISPLSGTIGTCRCRCPLIDDSQDLHCTALRIRMYDIQ